MKTWIYLILIFSSSMGVNGQQKFKRDTIISMVDGHKMVLYSSGAGKIPIIMEAGHGANHRCWRSIDSILSMHTRVITYDRPGYLASDSCTSGRDAETIANELKTALDQAGIDGPYLLTGWSLGGTFIRVFAGLFPEKVTALVLVDPAPENSYARFVKEAPEVMAEDSVMMLEILNSKIPGQRQELISFDKSMEQARISDGRYHSPVVLLISDRGKGYGSGVDDPDNVINRIWVEEQILWAGKNKNSKYKIISCGHHIAKEKPVEVIDAILSLLRKY